MADQRVCTSPLTGRYATAPDCPGCTATLDNPKPHNAECRARFEKLIGDERAKEAAAREQRAAETQEPTGDPEVLLDIFATDHGAGSTARHGAGGPVGLRAAPHPRQESLRSSSQKHLLGLRKSQGLMINRLAKERLNSL